MAAAGPQGNTVPLTAGRRAALAIGVPACLLVVAYAGLDLVAVFGQGSFPVGYTAPSVARSASDWPDTLTVTTPSGQIAVNGSTTGPARVTGTARYSLVRSKVTEHAAAGIATVGYHCAVPVGNCEFDATVSAPATVPVSVSTGGGNVDVTGTSGLVSVSTGGGNVSANQTLGPLNLQTTGGNIQAAQVGSAFLSATSGGGNIDLVFSSVPGDVRVDTTGGNVTVVLPPTASYHVTAHTDGGRVTDAVAQDTSSPNVITVTTGGGDITIIRG